MRKMYRNNIQTESDVSIAGKAFICFNTEQLLQMIDDGLSRNNMIKNLYLTQEGFYDKNIDGTKARVNALLRIIRSDNLLYALNHIIESPFSLRVGAKDKAKDIIEKLHNGEIKLPKLDY